MRGENHHIIAMPVIPKPPDSKPPFGDKAVIFFGKMNLVAARNTAGEQEVSTNRRPARAPKSRPARPAFPATEMGLSVESVFAPQGLGRKAWTKSGPIREIFKTAFAAAGLTYFNPHSFRDMLVRHIMTLDLPVETLKAWSQNLGHQGLLTTLTSYSTGTTPRQAELIRKGLPKPGAPKSDLPNAEVIAAAVVDALKRSAEGA